MNTIGIALVWCVVQVTLISVVTAGLYLVVRRLRPAAAASVVFTSLAIVVVLSLMAVSPWPRWTIRQDLPRHVGDEPKLNVTAFNNAPFPTDLRSVPGEGREIAATGNEPVPAKSQPSVVALLWQSLLDELANPQPAVATHTWHWPAVVAALFLATMTLGLGWLLLGVLIVRRERLRSRPALNRELLELVDVLRAELACRRPVEVRQSDDLVTAATIGWRKPLLLLPTDWTTWTADQRRAVLAHEIAHARSHDFLALLFGQLGLVLHFYHPLLHWLMNRLRLEQELAADAAAASISGGQWKYLTTIAELALHQQDRPLLWPARTFLPTQTTFLRRISMLRNSKLRFDRVSLAARFTAVGGVLVCGFLVAGLRGPGQPTQALAGEPGKAEAGRNEGFPRDVKLNAAQRNYRDWTEQFFHGLLGPAQGENLTPQEKDAEEEQSLKRLSSDDYMLRVAAINTLAALKCKKAVPDLLKIAAERTEKDNRDRWMAVRALGIIGDPSVVPELVPLTYHYNQNTRFWAQISLVRLTGENFGRDVAAWREWWTKQGGNPPIAEQKVAWATSPEAIKWADPEKLDEMDRQWATGKPTSKSDGNNSIETLTREAEAGDFGAKYKVWAAYHKGIGGVQKDTEKAQKWLAQLIEGMHVATFRPAGGFAPRTPQEFLTNFNEHSELRSGPGNWGGAMFFRTRANNGVLIGSFLTLYPDKMRKAIDDNPSLKLISIEKVTPEMFVRYDASPQESLDAADKYAPGSETSERRGVSGAASQAVRKQIEALGQTAEATPKVTSVHIAAEMRTPPQDNFSAIGANYEFVPIDIWKQFGEKPKWRVEKPERVAVMNGDSTVMLIRKQTVVKFPHPAESAFDNYWLVGLCNSKDIINRDLRAALAKGWDVKVADQISSGGEKEVVVTVEAKGDIPPDQAKAQMPSYYLLKNKFFAFADMRRVYRFDAKTARLEGFDAYLHQSDGDVKVFTTGHVEYNQPTDPKEFTLEIPKTAQEYKEPQRLPDNEKYEKMTPEETARAFFEACAKEDWNEAGKFYQPLSDNIKKYLGGLELVHLGKPFKPAFYAGWMVPYEIKFKDGNVKKWNLAVRNDNPAKRYVVDGGL